MDQTESSFQPQECSSSKALADVLDVLEPYMSRVTRIDVTESRVSIDIAPLRHDEAGNTIDSSSKPERVETLRKNLPGAVFPARPK
jgi:hypothetical protein